MQWWAFLNGDVPVGKEGARMMRARKETAKHRPEDLVGKLVQLLLHEGESGRCPLFPPARVVRVLQRRDGIHEIHDYVVEFIQPVEVTTVGDIEEQRFRGLTQIVMKPHHSYFQIERLLGETPEAHGYVIDIWKPMEGVNLLESPYLRRGIELEEWSLGGGEVRLYVPGKKFRPKFTHESRWRRKLNRMRAQKV